MKRKTRPSSMGSIPFLRNRRAARLPLAKPYRLKLEQLESRLAPANVNVTSFHYDPAIQGENLQETALTPTNVNAANFGKLANAQVDGYVYAQPLYMANLMIGGQPHNVVFVSTEHDSLYAFDVVSDPNAPTGLKLNQLWQRSFINPANGINTVPSGDVGSGDIVPEIGITGGGVIDPANNTLYLVAKTKETRGDGNHYVQTLYAIDITSATGANKTTPYVIGDSKGGEGFANQTSAIQVAGNGADSGGGQIKFDAFREHQRPSLQLLNGRVYIGWASHGDQGAYHGWVVGFNETTLQPEKWFNTTPNARAAGLWQSEGAISTDGTYLYFALGNGFNGPNPAFDPAHGNYSESVVKLDPTVSGTLMTVADYFTPFDWQSLDNSDADLGSGGVMLLPDNVGGNGTGTQHTHLMVETGKSGKIYLIDRDTGKMGEFNNGGPDKVVQVVTAGPGGVWGNPAFYQESANSGLIFYHGSGADTRAFRISNGIITPAGIAYNSGQGFGFPGAQPVISGSGSNNATAIDWELQSDNYGTQGPETLHAYMARPSANSGNLPELYNSNQTGLRDKLGGSVKFTTAIETNGWVFVGQEYNFSVFGLFPSHNTAPGAPSNLSGMGVNSTSIQLNWTNPNPNTATGIKIFRSTDGNNFTQVNTVAATATTYTDTGLSQGIVYYYKLAATNQVGDSPFSNTIQVSPLITAPVLSVDNLSSIKVAVAWTKPPVANDHYNVQRSTDPTFASFTTIAMNLPGNQLSYTDSDPLLAQNPGVYFYRVRAFVNSSGTQFADSNIVAAKIGPGSQTIDYSQPPFFPANPPDLQANGDAQFAETTARLTHQNNVAGSVFSVSEKSVLKFDDTFTVRLHEGTQPSYANGFAFVIQAISSSALGLGGQGLGYQGIANSVAIKFDTLTGASENGTGGSTGLFFGGDKPDVPHQTGEVNIPLDATMVNLESQSDKQIHITYTYNPSNPSQSVLHEEIVDVDHPSTPFEHDYMVDIPSLLGLAASGNTIGYVGFTASTGSGGNWEIQDVKSWKFLPTGPAAAHNLMVASGTNSNTLNWKATSADEEGYYVERSQSQNSGFTRIATLGAGVWTYTDSNVTNPQSYYYRVQTFNHISGQEQDSGYSNVATGAVVNIVFADFSTHDKLSANTGNPPVRIFPGNPPVMRLTDGQNSEASSSFDAIPIGTGPFTTTFTLKDVPNNGAADSLCFVIQNDPRGTAALGGGGGSGGYEGIINSICIKFDLYTHGSHNSSTGLFTGGQNPAGDATKDVPLAPIDLRTGDPIQVTLTYDGATLTETVKDTITNQILIHTYSLNLGQVIGGNTAYVGFTGATGGENATQDVLSWSGQFSQAPAQLFGFAIAAPSSVNAGSPFSITVTAIDQNNNAFPSYRGTVHFSSSDAQAGLPTNYTFTATDNGVHTFTGVTLKTAGNQSITATDTARPGINGTAPITVNPGAPSLLLVSGFPSPISQGTPGTFDATIKDNFGNSVTNYTGTLRFSSSDPQAVLPGNYMYTANDQGTHTFTATLFTLGSQSITATDTANSALSGTQAGIIVQQSGGLTIDYSTGFGNHSNLSANGTATFQPNGPALPVGIFADHLDIGNPSDPSPAGTATFNSANSSYALTASGSDMWNNDDHFQFVYEPLSGNGEIVARLTGATSQDFWTKTGVMFRASLSAGSANDFMLETPDPGHEEPVMQWRDTQSGGSNDTGNHTNHIQGLPVWLRLNRTGNVFTGYWAKDNNGVAGTWNQMGQHTTNMPTTVYVGLALTAHNNSKTASATFDHVSVTGTAAPLPATYVRLTDAQNGEAASLFNKNRVIISGFTTTFTFVMGAGSNPIADGMTFVIQNDPRGATALGQGGGAMGYGTDANDGLPPAIQKSLAIKFDAYKGFNSGDSNHSSTGVYINGDRPNNPPNSKQGDMPVDLAGTGIDFNGAAQANPPHPFKVTLSYNGTTLTETIVDTITNATFSHDYVIDIQALLGGNAGYVGFTAGTGGLNAIIDVQTWTGQFPSPQPPVTYLAIGAPANATAGTPFQVTVTALDSSRHQIAYSGTVHFSSSDTQAGLPADYTFQASDHGSHTFTVTLKTAGSQTLTVKDTVNNSLSATSPVSVSPAATSTLVVAGFPSSITAGVPGNFTVTAKDAYGNITPAYTGTVQFSSGDSQAVLPSDYTFVAADNGAHSFTATLKTAGPQAITATDKTNATIKGSQTGITVNPAAASSFSVAGFQSPITAGTPSTFTVTAKDPYNNVATGYTGTAHFTSSDNQAALPQDYTFVAGDNGTHSFSATLKTAGNQAITATDKANSSITGAQSGIIVNAAAASALLVAGFPSPATAGTGNTFTVTAVDPYGNTAVSYRGTVHFTSSDSQSLLPGDYTFLAADNSVQSFGAILDTAGNQTITATDTVTGSITGFQSVLVNPAGFLVSGFPSPTTAGTPGDFTVTVQDAVGNTITGYTGKVHFTSSDGKADLPADFTFTVSDGGVEMFTATLKTAGMQSITVTDATYSSVTGTQANIEVDPAAASSLLVAGFPSPIVAGTPGTFTVTAYDPYGNVATGYAGTVTFSSSDPQAALPADYTFVAGDEGTHTFDATLFTAGPQSITATDPGNGLQGTQSPIIVLPAPASSLLVDGYPSPVIAGTVNTFMVTAYDPYGNIATGYLGTVTFSSSDMAANLPADYTFKASDHGARIFAAVLNTVGIQSISATDTVDNTITGTQDNIEVDAPPGPAQSGPAPALVLGTNSGAPSPAPATADTGSAANGQATGSISPAPLTADPASSAIVDTLFAEIPTSLLAEPSVDDLFSTVNI
jgi:hypothetical protein